MEPVEGASQIAVALERALEDDADDLYENAPCGYLSTLPDGTLVKVNETFLRWTGYRREDLIGTTRFQELLTAGGRIFHETHYAPLLRMQGHVREIAVDLVCADGRRLPALVNSIMRFAANGDPMVVRTTVLDATERRAYERELLQARRRAEESEARARDLARTLQDSLIPPAPPQIPGLDVGAVYRPAGTGDEVGGDFYDVFETARDDWAIVVGDVCGKGVGAARVTALARYTLRATAMQSRRPRVVLGTLNRAVLNQDPNRYCTVVYARVRSDGGAFDVTVSSGGHPLPFRVDADGRCEVLGEPGSLLGVFEQVHLTDTTIELAPGDVVAFFTDGLTEARNDDGFYGEERLSAALQQHRHEPAAVIAQRIVDEVVAFQDGRPRDDIAFVVLKLPPRTAP